MISSALTGSHPQGGVSKAFGSSCGPQVTWVIGSYKWFISSNVSEYSGESQKHFGSQMNTENLLLLGNATKSNSSTALQKLQKYRSKFNSTVLKLGLEHRNKDSVKKILINCSTWLSLVLVRWMPTGQFPTLLKWLYHNTCGSTQ